MKSEGLNLSFSVILTCMHASSLFLTLTLFFFPLPLPHLHRRAPAPPSTTDADVEVFHASVELLASARAAPFRALFRASATFFAEKPATSAPQTADAPAMKPAPLSDSTSPRIRLMKASTAAEIPATRCPASQRARLADAPFSPGAAPAGRNAPATAWAPATAKTT